MRVLVGHAGRSAVERERDLVGAEERIQGADDGGAVAGVRGGVLGEVRRRSERLPGWVGDRVRVAVACPPAGSPGRGARTSSGTWRRSRRSSRRRRRRAPSPASGRSARDRGLGRAARREHAVVPLADVVVGPEERLVRLFGRPARAVDAAEVLDLVEVVGVRLARSASSGRRAGTASALRSASGRMPGRHSPSTRPVALGCQTPGPGGGGFEVLRASWCTRGRRLRAVASTASAAC